MSETTRLVATFAAFVLAGLSPRFARADLAEDADRLVKVWSTRGAKVNRLDPVFLEHGRARMLSPLEPRVTKDGRAEDAAAEPGCVTVAFLAVRTAEFTFEGVEGGATGLAADAVTIMSDPLHSTLRPHAGGDETSRARSAGGAAVLVRCGEKQSELRRVAVEMISSRAAVEVLVARSPAPLADIKDILPERAVGIVAPRGDPGGAIEPGALSDRLARSEKRARDGGATQVNRVTMQASQSGAGQFQVNLADGCHRLELMAEVPARAPRRATDLDAEARIDGGRLLARDRGDVPDARLDFCLGRDDRRRRVVHRCFGRRFGDAVGRAVSDCRERSQALGVESASRVRRALARRYGPTPAERPILEALGVQGITAVPIAVQPGRCYLASVALVRGEARAIRIAAIASDVAPRDEVVERPEGAAVAFCATEPSVIIEVDVRGNAPWWALAFWPMGGTIP